MTGPTPEEFVDAIESLIIFRIAYELEMRAPNPSVLDGSIDHRDRARERVKSARESLLKVLRGIP
jgi:hypothetical protein